MRPGFPHFSIPTEPQILQSFSPSRPRLFLSDLAHSALVIRNCTPNYRAIFARIQSNVPLSTVLGIDSDSLLIAQLADTPVISQTGRFTETPHKYSVRAVIARGSNRATATVPSQIM